MATWIPGITDYVPQIQPFTPDYNFLGNVLQTRQSRYDAAHKQLNNIYGTILNAPLSRESNIKRRDEFFKAVDGDIKKISGLDLSLQQNVDQAMAVFKPFYDDKDIINDMVKTKKYHSGIATGERLKNCLDPEKCGNMLAWNEGFSELNYKLEEFKKVSDEEALSFDMPDYTPYYNWEKDAVKLAKDANLSVEQDTVTGQWIVHDSGGKLIEGGLLNLYKSTYGNDPRVAANYNTKAYVGRKGYVKENWQQHGSEEAAEIFYMNNQINAFNELNKKATEQVEDAMNNVNGRKKDLQNKPITSEEEQLLQRISGVSETLEETKTSLDNANYQVNNNIENISLANMRAKADHAAANMMMLGDISNMAYTMSLSGAKHTVSANPYGIIATEQANRERTMALEDKYLMHRMSAQLEADLTLEDYKAGKKSGIIPSSVSTPVVDAGYSVVQGEDGSAVQHNTDEAATLNQEASVDSAKFLWDAFQTAKRASMKSPGANVYLKKMFGNTWPAIKTIEDMTKALQGKGLTLEAAFDNSIKSLDQTKNPMSDLSWADNLINTNGEKIQSIKLKNDASIALIQENVKRSKKVVESIKSQAGPGATAYADADLLLTPNGFPMVDSKMPVQYAANYKNKYKNDPDWFEHAEESYEVLREKFLESYKPIEGNYKQAYGNRYDNVNSESRLDPNVKLATNILQSVAPHGGLYTAMTGDPFADDIKNATKDNQKQQLLKSFFTQFSNDVASGKAGTFSYREDPRAGNDANTSSATFWPSLEYLKPFVGTKEAKGPLYDYVGDITKSGITMVFGKELNTPVTNTQKTPLLAIVAKNKGIQYTSYPHAVETASITYDESRGKYVYNATLKSYVDGKLKPVYVPPVYIEESALVNADKAINLTNSELNKKNIEIAKQLAIANSNKSQQ